MESINSLPDYDLDDSRLVTAPAQLHAMADPLRATLLDLVSERAATVSELARAVGRPKSTVAHHVGVLVAADLFRVVRTRRVRAIDERFYGRTARIFSVGPVPLSVMAPLPWTNPLVDAAGESEAAYRADTMWANHRHARILRSQAREFWRKVDELILEFTQLPREGETVFGFAAAVYPTEHPTLPPRLPPLEEPEVSPADPSPHRSTGRRSRPARGGDPHGLDSR